MKIATRLLFLVPLLLAACSPGPVGFVSMRRVFAESEDGKAATADIQRATAGAKKAAEDAAAEVDKGAGPLAESVVTAKRLRAAQLANEYREAVNTVDRRASDAVIAKARLAVVRVAADHRVGLVLSMGDEPLLAAPGVDLTGDLIKRMDAARAEPLPVAIADPVKLRAENERLERRLAELARQGKP